MDSRPAGAVSVSFLRCGARLHSPMALATVFWEAVSSRGYWHVPWLRFLYCSCCFAITIFDDRIARLFPPSAYQRWLQVILIHVSSCLSIPSASYFMPHNHAVLCDSSADCHRWQPKERVLLTRLCEASVEALRWLPQMACDQGLAKFLPLFWRQRHREVFAVVVAMNIVRPILLRMFHPFGSGFEANLCVVFG